MGKLVEYLFGIGKARCNLNMVLAVSKKKKCVIQEEF